MSNTIAKSLWPDQDSIGQCEAQREGRYLNDTPETDKRCAHSVKFEVDGKRLCARHAAQAALRVLLGNGRDEFIAAAINDARHFEKHRDELMAWRHRNELNARIGAAVQRACGNLPAGFDLHIELEKDAGSVRLYLADSDADLSDFGGDDLADYIDNAINVAIAEAEKGGAACN